MMAPRILIISNRYPDANKSYGGIYIKRHVELHRANGYDVTIVAPRSRFRGNVGRIASLFQYIIKLVLTTFTLDFDLVHAHWPVHAGFFAALISLIRRKPFVLTSHGAYIEDLHPRTRLTKALARFTLERANIVIVVGRQHRETVMRYGELPAERVRLIDMGVWYGDKNYSRIEARNKLKISGTQRVIIFIGNLETWKGVDILLRAYSLVVKELADTFLYAGGQGTESDHLLSMSRELNLQDTTKFLGPIQPDDVFLWFSAADVCVVPSRREPFGLVALEAMASGTIVIASDVGGLRETVKDGQNGFLFPSEDYQSLAECLVYVLSNDEIRNFMSENARKSARQYDMNYKAAQVAKIYQELVDSNCTKLG